MRSVALHLPGLLVVAVTSSLIADDSAALPERPISAADREHWAFRPLASAEPPLVRDREWVRNDIDRFILARLEAEGLVPLGDADRVTLARRVTFDLTGLPPTPQEVEAFVGDPGPEAYGKLVDRLLASPAHGERWAQHWLDLARFAETDGFEHDKLRRNAWRYRDWVVEAICDDVPYDEFVTLQLAGDEVRPESAGAAVATGFAICGPDMPDINLQSERRHMVLNEVTGTVGAVLLGLQVGCAACHDHKFDPISQRDFYRMRAIFEPGLVFKEQPLAADGRDKRLGRVLRERSAKTSPSFLWLRGDFRRKGAEVEPAFPRIGNPWGDRVGRPQKGARSSGRRSSFARWLTRPDNYLTTRVAANRIWQYHFGRGIVTTSSDFGTTGTAPVHPQLLDWLARRVVEEGWSWKRVHRLIVTSSTYRQAATIDDSADVPARHRNLARDPQNRLLWRSPRRRLEGEALRDAMLFVSGRLSEHRGGGPGVMPPLPKDVLKTIGKDHWKVSENKESHRRRSLYLFVRRNLRYPLFEAFDRPDGNASCARRERSTTAPQALMLLNSELSIDLARHFAGRVLRETGDARAAWIDHAYRLALGRAPRDAERRLAIGFLERQSAVMRRESRAAASLALPIPSPSDVDPTLAAALTDLCLTLFNLNEFLYFD